MVLVAPARDLHQQNLVTFQCNAAIFFVTSKDIAPGDELRVWYAKEYAAIMGTRPSAKPSGVPALEEENSSSGRQLRPRICPACQKQRSLCTCTTSTPQRRQASRPSRSSPSARKQTMGRQILGSSSGTTHKVALPVTLGTEMTSAISQVSQSVSGPVTVKSSEVSSKSPTVSEVVKNTIYSEPILSAGSSQISLLETSKSSTMTGSILDFNISTRTRGRVTMPSIVPSEGILSSGMRSVASRKQYSSYFIPTTKTLTDIEIKSSTTTSETNILDFPVEGVYSEFSSLPYSSEVPMLKSVSSDPSALGESGEGTVKRLREKMVGDSTASAMEGVSPFLRECPSGTKHLIEESSTASLAKSKLSALRSSLKPSKLRVSLRSKLQSGMIEESQKVTYVEKIATEQEQSEERPKTKKDIKNEENIQRQKGKSTSESSQGKVMEESLTSSVSSGSYSTMEVESELLEKRIESAKKDDDFTCPICLLVVNTLSELNEHVESHSGTSRSSSKGVEVPSRLSSKPGGNGDSGNDKQKDFVCPICFRSFISLEKLSQHIESHTSSSSKIDESTVTSVTFGIRGGGGKRRGGHTCRVCSKVFVSPGRLSNHMYTAHPGLSGSSSSAGEASTPRGSAGSGSAVKRKGNHICPICSKVFGSPGKLSQHMYSHTGERPFACSECNKAFSSKFKLVRHALIHSSDSERRYRCNACDRSFHRKDHLQNHAKVHSVVRARWRCERCGREYGSPLSHRRHIALHAAQDDGALDCGVCGRHFNSTPDILHHLKVHAGSRTVKSPADRKFRCEHCERRFFTRKDVRRHLVVHTGKRDFLCQFCPQRFGRKDHLVRHIKKSHHQGNVPSSSRGSRGGRRHRSTVAATSTSGKLDVPSTSLATAEAEAIEQLQVHSTLYGSSSGVEDVILLPSAPAPFLEVKPEEASNIPQGSMLEETSILPTSQILTSESSLKMSSIQTILHSTSPGYTGESPSMSRTSDVVPKSEEVSLLPAVPSMDQPSGPSMGIVYTHPPPPYPSGDMQSQPYKVYEEGNREGMIKLEPAASSRVGDFAQLLSLIPSTSQSSVLSDTLSEQESLLMATQHEDLQRLLSGGTEQGQLLSEEQQQLFHLVETAASSVTLDLPSEVSASDTGSDAPSETDMMASLLASEAAHRAIGATSTTPLPRFTQAFQSQQQQQQPPQPHQQQSPSHQQQEPR